MIQTTVVLGDPILDSGSADCKKYSIQGIDMISNKSNRGLLHNGSSVTGS